MEQDCLGRHLIIELWGCNGSINDAAHVKAAMLDAVTAANATLLNIFVHTFSPQGVTGVAVLAESHLSIHTWPEHGYAAADVYTCGTSLKTREAADVLCQAFQASQTNIMEVTRGVPPGVALPQSGASQPVTTPLDHARKLTGSQFKSVGGKNSATQAAAKRLGGGV